MKWLRRKKLPSDEVVIRKIKKVTIIERRNGTRTTEELTSEFNIRPPKRIGWPSVILIIFLVLLVFTLVIGYFAVGFQGLYEFLKDLLGQLIEQLPDGA